jgi:hypothetical protein
MKKLLLALSCTLISVAVAQRQFEMSDMPEYEVFWHGFWRVDMMEVPGWQENGPTHPSKAEEATGDGTRFLQDTVYMTEEGAQEATSLIRAALTEFQTFGVKRQKDQCARNAIPSDSAAAYWAYIQEEIRQSDAKQAQLVEDFLRALPPADALAFRQWVIGGSDFRISRREVPELSPEAEDPDPKEMVANICKYAASMPE